jgi:hypothetical protein
VIYPQPYLGVLQPQLLFLEGARKTYAFPTHLPGRHYNISSPFPRSYRSFIRCEFFLTSSPHSASLVCGSFLIYHVRKSSLDFQVDDGISGNTNLDLQTIPKTAHSLWILIIPNCEKIPQSFCTEFLFTILLRRHQISTPSFTFNPNNKFRKDYPPRSFASAVPMNSTELPLQSESPVGVWSSPTPHTGRPSRPATIHEATFSFCVAEPFTSLPAWDSSAMPMQQLGDGVSQTFTVQQEFFPSSVGERKSFPSMLFNGVY